MFRLDAASLEESKQLLRNLIRIDTSNPPGNEAAAARYLQSVLEADGISTVWLEPEPGRANLVARLAGDGSERPILLSSHLDVVPAKGKDWQYPPFEGVEADGCIWGRGAVDMKGFAAMAVAVIRQIHRRRQPLKRDLIFAAVADEESGCTLGSTYLVNHHPELVRAEFAINEVGGFHVDIRGRRFYLIQRAERGVAWLRLTYRGAPAHSSMPVRDSCLAQAAKAITALHTRPFPHHPNAAALDFLDTISRNSPWPEKLVLRALRHPRLGALLLQSVVPAGTQRQNLQASLSNSVTPTVVRAGHKTNVLPSEVVIELDGRIVPGSSLEELIRELRNLIGPGGELEILTEHAPVQVSTHTEFYRNIEQVLLERDPEATPAPYLISGFTDSWNWAKLGTACYGFYPLRLPPGFDFAALFHGVDERIPVEGLRFGIECLHDLLERVAFA